MHKKVTLFTGYSPDTNLPIRYSMDNTTLKRNRALDDICIQFGLRILNGHTIGDLVGQYTCHTPRGSSVTWLLQRA